MTNPAILHIGFGQFHRAHQAVYINSLNATLPDQKKIKIYPMSLKKEKPDSFKQLENQKYKYSVTSFQGEAKQTQFINVHANCILGLKEFRDLPLAQKENIKWITITATEKAYNNLPNSMPHSLCQILEDFFENGISPPLVVSCDNLMLNGDLLKNLVSEINLREEIFSSAELDELKFANSLVDRIVPAHKKEWTEIIHKDHGFQDQLCVFTEHYCAWVIEDKHVSTEAKLSLDKVGVTFVNDIKPHNQQKLFLLNGAHSLLAYLGLEQGHTTVEQAIQDPQIVEKVKEFWATEAQPFLSPQLDNVAYCENLIRRFRNPFVSHQLIQIAQDGFQKIRQRWLPLLVYRHSKNKTLPPVITSGLKSYYDFAVAHLGINDQSDFLNAFEVDQMLTGLINEALNG